MSELLECKPTGNPNKKQSGIGMPQSLYLEDFGELLSNAFDGEIAYHVGSSLYGSTWRDVDVRIMLDKEKYKAMGLGDPEYSHSNPKWCALCIAFSELGRKMTGLPIDFQIQETEWANAKYPYGEQSVRSALIQKRLRIQEFMKK